MRQPAITRWLAGLALGAALALSAAAQAQTATSTPANPPDGAGEATGAGPTAERPLAILRGLDKITARISTIEAPIDSEVRFGTLHMLVRHCEKRPPEEPPETTAFLEIWEQLPDEPRVVWFSGWMFASSPAVSALEHPVYDVWVIDCKTASPESPSGNR
ncbi:DUF2155 domain-containing protein [Oceanibacterium hippocampi]|uniref:DUF2155 domain-containing protein n=1 Tax=Oceanibacterium hippocampi TaxID=745714 RepID=A0A1Y5SXL7_9PROT|nr:DUF2155 domain-containing protein [Oceanibacterium hippocampi]SLN48837.1 hypothetical protein OCH7691_02123 [Oceanibacterium hippocampi]